ncbi:MAG: phosphoenolpyruvate--protein phosphotransferase [Planctomycetaceae bacterium]|nr:phosphoenolpyruvate--protein phosphotransferase [Planctomycetaceae bacterium]
MMIKLQGTAVSPGVAIGDAFVMGAEGFRIPKHFVLKDAVDDELRRFQNARQNAEAEIARNRDSVAQELGSKYADIFEAHIQILRDPKLVDEIEGLIREKMFSPEHAVSVTIRKYADIFRRLDSNYLAERIQDIYDIEKRLLRLLLGIRREGLNTLTAPVLVLASNLSPSETANLNREFVKGFVTELGGPSGHTAILAAALEIPAIVGVGSFLNEVSGGDTVIIDGDHGTIIIRPDEETVAHYTNQIQKRTSFVASLDTLREQEAILTDNVKIELLGNIEFPHEAAYCLDRGAEGIGLYRTEFLYLAVDKNHIPSEEDHYEAYSQVARAMAGRPVTIRTCDLGADKMPNVARPMDERNPFLGLRSIRLSLRNVQMFKQQLRAILRSSVHGKPRIMFPLISSLVELRQAKMILADVREELEDEGIPFDKEIPVGMMVEVPAAVMMIDQFAREVDFFSIGTNDLIQYTLAVDRSNKDVSVLFNSEDPSVLRMIQKTIEAASQENIPVCLCGQMSSNSLYTILLIGLGLRSFSCSPSVLSEIKKVCRSVDSALCQEVAKQALQMDSARDIRSLLRERLRAVVPELVNR